MKVKILDVYEFKGQLRVKVEHEYGKENIGLSLDATYLDDMGQPAWKNQVKELLNKKYGNRDKVKALRKVHLFKEEIGKTIDI